MPRPLLIMLDIFTTWVQPMISCIHRITSRPFGPARHLLLAQRVSTSFQHIGQWSRGFFDGCSRLWHFRVMLECHNGFYLTQDNWFCCTDEQCASYSSNGGDYCSIYFLRRQQIQPLLQYIFHWDVARYVGRSNSGCLSLYHVAWKWWTYLSQHV